MTLHAAALAGKIQGFDRMMEVHAATRVPENYIHCGWCGRDVFPDECNAVFCAWIF